jgi:hypothetical protein
MILLNFSHALTGDHLAQIEALTDQDVEQVRRIDSQIDVTEALAPQVIAIADEAGLSADEWETRPLLVNPPSLNYIAVALLAELHGRCGHFPACLRVRPVAGSVPTRYEVAEIINLQALRDAARRRRSETLPATSSPEAPKG